MRDQDGFLKLPCWVCQPKIRKAPPIAAADTLTTVSTTATTTPTTTTPTTTTTTTTSTTTTPTTTTPTISTTTTTVTAAASSDAKRKLDVVVEEGEDEETAVDAAHTKSHKAKTKSYPAKKARIESKILCGAALMDGKGGVCRNTGSDVCAEKRCKNCCAFKTTTCPQHSNKKKRQQEKLMQRQQGGNRAPIVQLEENVVSARTKGTVAVVDAAAHSSRCLIL